MNTAAMIEFMNAHYNGVKVIKTDPPALKDGSGYHPIGLLLHRINCQHLYEPREWLKIPANAAAHELCLARVSKDYGISRAEWGALQVSINDGLDFLSLVWKHGKYERASP